MSRIRSIKPEWLDDELMASASSDARTLSVALLLLADDYGNGRAAPVLLAGRVFPGKVLETLASALAELVEMRFIVLYENAGQKYFSIRNWEKHQKVDKPGKPHVPAPSREVTDPKPPPPEKIRESLEKVLETLAPDLDLDQDLERKGAGSPARAQGLAVVTAGTPDALDTLAADFAACRRALRMGFSRRWEAAQQPGMWLGSGSPAVDKLAQWIQSLDGNRQAALDRMLDTFFADEWVRSHHFDIEHLARHAPKYLIPRAAPSGPANGNGKATVESIRAEMDRAVAAEDWDLANTLKRKLEHAERQLPENQPKWGNNGR